MLLAMSLSLLLVLATLFIHFEALRRTSALLPHCSAYGRFRVLLVVCAAFGAHILEVFLYALAFYLLENKYPVGMLDGEHARTTMDYFYYSTVMFTSLGIGDVSPGGHLRVISGIEALNGLILIGWSTSFTFLSMRRFWPLEAIHS